MAPFGGLSQFSCHPCIVAFAVGATVVVENVMQARSYVPMLGSLLAVPFMAGTVLVPSFHLSMFLLFMEYLFAECWFGPALSVMQSELPLNVIGLSSAIFVLGTTVVSPRLLSEVIECPAVGLYRL